MQAYSVKSIEKEKEVRKAVRREIIDMIINASIFCKINRKREGS